LEWYGKYDIKCGLELKCADTVIVQDTTIEYAGISGGSTGFVLLLTPRNQDGTAPWSLVQHVRFERVTLRNGGGVANLMGHDSPNQSGTLNDIVFKNVYAENIDPKAGPWNGQGRCFLVTSAPSGIVLDGVTVKGANLGASFYFDFEVTNGVANAPM